MSRVGSPAGTGGRRSDTRPTKPQGAAPLEVHTILAALGIAGLRSRKGIPYTAIPGKNGPRWIVPNRPKLTRAAFREWHPYSGTGQMSWAGVRLLARFGALRYLPGVSQMRLPEDAGEQLLKSAGWKGEIAAPIILVGNPSPLHKVIVLLANAKGELTGVAKFPLAEGAAQAIRHEAEMLRRLDGKFGAPRLLHYSAEAACSVQAYLPGRLGGRKCKPKYVDFLVSLTHTGETLPLAEKITTLISQLQSRPEYFHSKEVLAGIFRNLESRTTGLPATLVHGDFAPWNIRDLPGGACTLVDWESGQWRGFPLHDLCHFFYMQTRLFAKKESFYSRLLASGCLRTYCEETGITADHVPQLTAAYLATTLRGHWEAGEDEFAAFCLAQMEEFLKR